MRGDILIISERHRKAARQVFSFLEEKIRENEGKYFITVAGESGAGKSETAAALAEVCEKHDLRALVVQQDDFFIYPPKTNAAMRVKSGGDVGPQEVRIALLNDIIREIRSGKTSVSKPLVIFEEDRIVEEKLEVAPYKVIILEGTYTTLLQGVDCHIFIDRNLEDTREDRLKRNRETQDDFLEKILMTEHRIISGHRQMADLIVSKDFDASVNNTKHEH